MGWARGLGAAAMALVCLLASPAVAQAPEQPATFIVFDGSGSMAAPFANTRLPRVGLAREALGRALQRVPQDLRLGLVAFGHRRGDCADIEVMRPAEPVDAPRTNQLLEKLSPRGRGPLTQALRVAAKELPQTRTAMRSLILIHDDADNCTVDLCALAAELGKARIAVHAIGLALKPEDKPKMACLAQLTGGRLYNPTTPEQVGAAIDEALKLASAGAIPKPSASAPLQGERAEAEVPETAPQGLYLRARLAAKGPLLRQPLQWTVLPDGDNQLPVYSDTSLNPFVAVPPGKYRIEGRDGPLQITGTANVVKDKPTVLVLTADAAVMRTRLATLRGGISLPTATVTVARPPAEGEPALSAPIGDVVSAYGGMEGTFLLPQGRYLVRAQAGLARTQKLVTLTPGADTALDLTLDVGLLQLEAPNTTPGLPAVFAVLEDDPDAPRGRREIFRTAERTIQIPLPPGTYTVELRQAGIETRERLVVPSGEVVRRTLTLAAAQVSLSSRLGAQALSEQLSYAIERIDGGGSEGVTTSKPQPTLLLAPGRYRIEGRYGNINARVVREVEVRAGAAVQQIVFDHAAGQVRLKAAGAPGEVFWDIRDAAGRPVWSTGQPEPELTLQAGSYVVRAGARDRQVERTLDLRAGERRTLEVSFE